MKCEETYLSAVDESELAALGVGVRVIIVVIERIYPVSDIVVCFADG